MKILMVSYLYPDPPHITGGHRRLAPILRDLAATHELTLLLFSEDPPSTEEAKGQFPGLRDVETLAWEYPERGWGPYLRSFWEYRNEKFRGMLAQRVANESFDLAYCYGGGMAQYGSVLRDMARIIDTVDSHSLYVERRAAGARTWKEKLSTRHDLYLAKRYERKHFPIFDGCFTVAPRDTQRIQLHCPDLPTWTVPLGVDVEYFDVRRVDESSRRIIFSGRMGFLDNILAARFLADEVFPRVRREVPEAELILVGGWVDPEVAALGQRDGITVAGFVEDLREAYRDCRVSVAPLLSGAGIKCKVLEAMSMRTPVVMTSLAAEGLENLTGNEAVVADDPSAIAEATIELLRNPDKARIMGEVAREYVVRNYSERSVCRRVQELLHLVLDEKRRREVSAPDG